MAGSPVRMDRQAHRMRRWMRIDRDGILSADEETALHDFLEALRGIDLFAFRQSCGASIYEIARVMHVIECRAHYAIGWMRQYLYESRKGRQTGRPVLMPSDPELARDVWATCARLLEMPAAR